MENKEYGIKLNLDIGSFKNKLEEAKSVFERTKDKFKEGFQLEMNENKLRKQAKTLQDDISKVNKDIDIGKITGIENIKSASRSIEWWNKELQLTRNELTAINNPFKNLNNLAFTLGYRLRQLGNTPLIRIKQETKQSEEEMENLDDEVNKTSKSTFNLSSAFKKLGNDITGGIQSGVRNIKRFSLSMLGIHSIWIALSRAVRSYMALDDKMSVRMQANWVAIGAIFAPIVEKIIRGLQKLVAYINVFVKAFTGGKVDLLSRALNQAEKSAKGTTKALKSMNKELSTLDELENLNFDQGGGDVDEGGFGLTDALQEIQDIKLNPELVAKVQQLAEFVKTTLLPALQSIKNFITEHIVPAVRNLWKLVEEGKVKWEDILVVIGLVKGGIEGGMMTAVGLLIAKVLELNDAWEQQRRAEKSLGDTNIKTMYTVYDRIKEIDEKLKDQNLTTEERNKLEGERNSLIDEAKDAYNDFNDMAKEGYEFTQDQVDEMNQMRSKLEELTNKKWEYNFYIKLHPEAKKSEWYSFWDNFADILSDYANKINPWASSAWGSENKKGKKFAKGNVAYQPTMAEFGEYAGARSNPEITAPQNMIRQTLSEALVDAIPQIKGGSGDTILYVNGRELARATYNDFQTEGNRLGGSGVAIRRVS